MRRGMMSLDAMIAITMLLFVIIWFQSFSLAMVDNANVIGIKIQSRALPMAIGSQVNAFRAINPQDRDYACVKKPALKVFPSRDVTNYVVTVEPNQVMKIRYNPNTFEDFDGNVQDILYKIPMNYPVLSNITYKNGVACVNCVGARVCP